MKDIPFKGVDEALPLCWNFMMHLCRKAVDAGWPSSGDKIGHVQDVLKTAWEPFGALLEYYHNVDVSKVGLRGVVTLGFGDGGQLAGRVVRFNKTLDPDVVAAIAKIGDDLGGAAADLSDDAARGLGKVVDDAGEGGAKYLFQGLSCAVEMIAAGPVPKTAGLAAPLAKNKVVCDQAKLETALKIAGEVAGNWSDEALEGLGRVVDRAGEDAARRLTNLIPGSLDDKVTQRAFAVVAAKGDDIWNAETIEGLARVFEQTESERALKFLSQEYSDEIVRDTLKYINDADLAAPSNILARVDDTRDLFQWQAKGNALEFLDDPDIILRRLDMPDVEYQAFKQSIFDRWNNGQPLDGTRLAEAFAVEATIKQLQKFGNYKVVHVLTKEGGQGPDAILKNLITGKWVILEGKGTLKGFDLSKDTFRYSDMLGRQLSKRWITTNPQRYLRDIDPNVQPQVQQMLREINRGVSYEVVVGCGGIKTKSLDYGTEIDEFITEIKPLGTGGQGWTIDFVFVNLLPK
ncbi:MAG: hypothetical protein JW953_13360 [Anaerolineae bacterium]|nr:hypothetical protein [Anaerolineae bacterium]